MYWQITKEHHTKIKELQTQLEKMEREFRQYKAITEAKFAALAVSQASKNADSASSDDGDEPVVRDVTEMGKARAQEPKKEAERPSKRRLKADLSAAAKSAAFTSVPFDRPGDRFGFDGGDAVDPI